MVLGGSSLGQFVRLSCRWPSSQFSPCSRPSERVGWCLLSCLRTALKYVETRIRLSPPGALVRCGVWVFSHRRSARGGLAPLFSAPCCLLLLSPCCSLPVSPPCAFCDRVAPHGAVLPCGLCFPPPWCCVLGCGLPSALTILIGWRLTGVGFHFPCLWRSCVLGSEELHQGPGRSLVSSGHCRPPSSRCLSEAMSLSVAMNLSVTVSPL